MSKLSLFLTFLALLGLSSLAAQPKIVFNTEQSKKIRVRPGDTIRLAIKIANYGTESIDENYEIVASFNPTEGFLSSTRYVLEQTQLQGISLDVNEVKTFVFEYPIPADAPEISQNLIFSAQNDGEALHLGGGYLFLRIKIESRTPLPDLMVRNFRFPRFQNIYRELPLTFDIINRGELLSFESTTTNLYLSASGELDENSIFLTSYEVPPLVVGGKITIEDTFGLEKIPPAVYRLIIVVDEEDVVRENDEVNNVFNFGFAYPINDNAFPDLFFSFVDFPRELFIGDPTASQKIRTVIWNQTRPRDIEPIRISTPICNRLYLSKNTRLDETDRFLGTAVLSNGIDGNRTAALFFTPNECFDNQNNTTLFPSDIEAGRYYLIFVLDAENIAIEYFENNNTLVRRVQLSNSANNFAEAEADVSPIVSTISLYPNPASEQLIVQYKSSKKEQITPYALYDIQGKMILSGKWENFVGENQQELDLSAIDEGFYFLRIGNAMKKVTIVR